MRSDFQHWKLQGAGDGHVRCHPHKAGALPAKSWTRVRLVRHRLGDVEVQATSSDFGPNHWISTSSVTWATYRRSCSWRCRVKAPLFVLPAPSGATATVLVEGTSTWRRWRRWWNTLATSTCTGTSKFWRATQNLPWLLLRFLRRPRRKHLFVF